MQVQIRQQANNQHIQSINQAVLTMQEMSEYEQRKVFSYIELLVVQDRTNSTKKVEKKSKKQDKQAMLDELLGCMEGITIDDPKKEYHQYLDEKYAEYFTDNQSKKEVY